MLGEEECEHWTRTWEEEEVIHWPSAIWMRITSSSSMAEGAGEAGCEESQRARGMGEGESVVC